MGLPATVVIGAGVVGCLVASELTTRDPGALVTVVDRDAVGAGAATVVERAGRITGYATRIAYFAHAVADTNDDLQALIAAAKAFEGPGFIVPSRNAELMRWCLGKGLRMTQPLTLMTMGLYNEPAGAYLPSILY